MSCMEKKLLLRVSNVILKAPKLGSKYSKFI